jgi:hypothetical protein
LVTVQTKPPPGKPNPTEKEPLTQQVGVSVQQLSASEVSLGLGNISSLETKGGFGPAVSAHVGFRAKAEPKGSLKGNFTDTL